MENMFYHLRMNLAFQKKLGHFTKVLRIGVTPHFGKNSQKIPFFWNTPNIDHCIATYDYDADFGNFPSNPFINPGQ